LLEILREDKRFHVAWATGGSRVGLTEWAGCEGVGGGGGVTLWGGCERRGEQGVFTGIEIKKERETKTNHYFGMVVSDCNSVEVKKADKKNGGEGHALRGGGEASKKRKAQDTDEQEEEDLKPKKGAAKKKEDEEDKGEEDKKIRYKAFIYKKAAATEVKDATLECRDCSADFIFTAGEQEFYKEKGYNNKPARCAVCKAANKARCDDGGWGRGGRCGVRGGRGGFGDRGGGRGGRGGSGVLALCYGFQRGECTRGSSCRFSHSS
jgi:hypothetical protein